MSSKYSQKEKISRKLEQSIEERLRGLAVSEKDDLSAEEMEGLSPELFEFAEYDEKEAERTGAARSACSLKTRWQSQCSRLCLCC